MPAICKNIIILHLILLFGVSISYSNDGFKPSPEDTVNKFIKNYGKDSLIQLLDIRIKDAEKWVNYNSKEMYVQNTYAEMILISRHFNLGLDTLPFFNYFDSSKINSLYGKYFGDTLQFTPIIDKSTEINKDFGNVIINDIKNPRTRAILAVLCSHFPLSEIIIDSFYSTSKQFTIQDKILSYFQLSEIQRKCGNSINLVNQHKNSLFKEIYAKNNLEQLLLVKREYSDAYISEFNLELPIQIIALGLYGKDITLAKNGKELMYLLKTQNSDFGWRTYNSVKFESEINSSFYGLWALCEFREQLQKLKGQLKE